MLQKNFLWLRVLVLIFSGCAMSVGIASAEGSGVSQNQWEAAIARSASTNRSIYLCFYGQEDSRTQAMREVFRAAATAVRDRADSLEIPVNDPSAASVVSRFGVREAPLPLALVLAPNGAVTASFPETFTTEQLVGGLATPAMEKLLASLQKGKLVFVCVQNRGTQGAKEAMGGVDAFKNDQRYAAATDVVLLDPARPEERPFLEKLGVKGQVQEAVTFFLVPPGSIIGSFKGATQKNVLVATLTTALKGCGPGCKPGACGPSN
jgi:hypothetical protein